MLFSFVYFLSSFFTGNRGAKFPEEMANEPFARRLTLRKAGQVELLGETPNQPGANRSCRPPPGGCQNYFLAKKGKIIKPRIAQISGVQQDCRFEFEKCGQVLSARTGDWNESPGVDSNKVSRLTPVLEQVWVLSRT
jgi:hypothetical protein